MLCSSPIALQATGAIVPCGQCMSCRINRNRIWTGRMLMESCGREPGTMWFATLTYDPANLPVTSSGFPTLSTEDVEKYVKRLRERVRSRDRDGISFFLAGEYGEKTGRPHYHVCLFGLPWHQQRQMDHAWGLGLVEYDLLTQARMAYTAQYCMKKITGKALDDIPEGSRLPEFARMSRRPALGDKFIYALADRLNADARLSRLGVPTTVRFDGKEWPVGDRHQRIMRAALGRPATRGGERELLGLEARNVEPPTIEALQTREVNHAAKKAVYQSRTRKI